ncbi:MAG: DUF3343 domain-containing protein [Clostridiales bacterium]|jgi:hypothetical protein|nr:DUF3343 domain-containing protein [Eubacteriales bacterium]MDH7567667.1 DUF3343 domain-containing protein [Clostridiales bacterium]
MDCLALLDSGNFAYKLCSIFEKKGYIFEVVSTPCHIAKDGCGYCIKFPAEFKELLVSEGIKNKTPIREIYKIIPAYKKNKYEKIY